MARIGEFTPGMYLLKSCDRASSSASGKHGHCELSEANHHILVGWLVPKSLTTWIFSFYSSISLFLRTEGRGR